MLFRASAIAKFIRLPARGLVYATAAHSTASVALKSRGNILLVACRVYADVSRLCSISVFFIIGHAFLYHHLLYKRN